jgi:hypothetical protein
MELKSDEVRWAKNLETCGFVTITFDTAEERGGMANPIDEENEALAVEQVRELAQNK